MQGGIDNCSVFLDQKENREKVDSKPIEYMTTPSKRRRTRAQTFPWDEGIVKGRVKGRGLEHGRREGAEPQYQPANSLLSG